ncbi:diguanylate cyclase [Thalassomonas viridans]|uniref:diguanylate cyclase n=1 Tax=Thalassomonas viridans TaxID=137584 RepID=A0AAE9Z6X5_9GAMM|nr:diguanylate cyclase [Thalassomonas viridans]WDE06227.1 diguanylate cyclase [Thalassomonas viridans]
MSMESFHSTITNQLNTGVLILDLDFNIVFWNRFLEVHANKRANEVIGQSIFTVFGELPRRWFERKVAGVVQLNTPSFCSWEQRHHLFELPHTRPITTDSHFMAQNCTFLPLAPEGEIQHVCILIEDATDVCHYQSMLQKTLTELEYANRIDGLTQVYNRKHWEECLSKEFDRARRYQHDLSLIMFDLDHFKKLNDVYGHLCGDMVLVEVAKTIKPLLRSCDCLGRYGGEEFAIILPETNISGAVDVAERVRQAIALKDMEYQGVEIKASVSVGIGEFERRTRRYEDLIGNADAALYEAKSGGRNRTCLFKDSVICL